MVARLNTEPEPFKIKEKPGNLKPVIAGVNRSGKRRVGQLADFESSEEPTAESLQTDWPDNLLVGTADPLESLLPAQTGRSASVCDEIESGQLVRGGNTSQVQVQVQSDLRRNSVSSEFLNSNNFLNVASNSVIMANENDKETDDDVVVMEDSPIVFNEKKLPKKIKSNSFISVITTTHTLRTKVFKHMKNVDKILVQVTSMEQGEIGKAQEEFLDGLYGDIQKEYNELKGRVKAVSYTHLTLPTIPQV